MSNNKFQEEVNERVNLSQTLLVDSAFLVFWLLLQLGLNSISHWETFEYARIRFAILMTKLLENGFSIVLIGKLFGKNGAKQKREDILWIT